jgi:hypothetical protein
MKALRATEMNRGQQREKQRIERLRENKKKDRPRDGGAQLMQRVTTEWQ